MIDNNTKQMIDDEMGYFFGFSRGSYGEVLGDLSRTKVNSYLTSSIPLAEFWQPANLGKIGKMFGGEVRDIMARVCASQLSVYLSRNLPEIIENTHVWNIIHDSIISLDEAHLELLTRQVANRELYGITIWGGVIGALVSTVMCLVMYVIG